MRTPHFWQTRSIIAYLLFPLSLIYSAISSLYQRSRTPVDASIPLICIGNAVAGGAGKTPVALALADMLTASSKKVFFLSRGYRGKLSAATLVDIRVHDAASVGDEALLLARKLPTIIARKRAEGAALAAQMGAEFILMDDGFQNNSIKKSCSLLVIDGEYGIGNGWKIPAGPLRENFSTALSRADAVIMVGEDRHGLTAELPDRLPVFNCWIIATNAAQVKGKKLVAFAGIGRPEKFFSSLESCGAILADRMGFPDHHFYTEDDMLLLDKLATEHQAQLVTTSKDWVKLPALLQQKVLQFEIRAEIEGANILKQKLLALGAS